MLKFLKITLCTLLILGTVSITVAHASGEGDGARQTPAQVVVQIVLTAIALKALDYFDLP